MIGWSIAIAYAYVSSRKRSAENCDVTVAIQCKTTITKGEERERERERKSSLARERVRDKIASNELSGPDVSLMRTAEIISSRDRNARAYATPPAIHAASLFSRDSEGGHVPCFR